ncbi:Uncharacterized protein PB2B2.06c [Erysiphe neolycopersici]|uniref:Uncharacterized protein PB2B2.06c n=1 Tax=Erysiphe neolycopersici TaxID=212602 RepID=A0A420HVV4_9PEZI|nr:Uncharacterized protein PB2B2.06c [Erysiphe neolycopersici]
MRMSKYLFPLILATLATAEQPKAVSPVTAPSRNLSLGQLNFLHTTDSHGWHPGHLQEGQYSADFGDYISFIQRMREKTDAAGTDLLVIDTGDRVEGNGLFDSSNPQGLYTYDIIKEVEYDVLIPGNHELYHPSVVDAEYTKIALATKDKYIASNVDYIDHNGNQVPLGQRYRVFQTKNQGIKIAAFGFLYNFIHHSNNSVVQPVEETVQESWFQEAIREKVDLFLICGHIPLDEYEFKVIHKAIRDYNKYTPIQIFGSHSHIRNFIKFDSRAAGLQSGRYLETIGWASINGLKNKSQADADDEVTFHRRYIDANILAYRYHTGLNVTEFPTERGKNVTSFIAKARKNLDLDYKYGCVPRDLSYNRSPFSKNDSVATWMAYEFLPDIARKNSHRANVATVVMMNIGFMRTDLMKGPYTRDTSYMFTPFNENLKLIKNVPYKPALEIAERGFWHIGILDDHYITQAPTRNQTQLRSRGLVSKSTNWDIQVLDNQKFFTASKPPTLVRGYTTVDDGGSDGDDTLHLPIPDIITPPPILHAVAGLPAEGEPEYVDLVINTYPISMVLNTLNDMGYNFNTTNVEEYSNELIRDIVSQWVKNNWAGEC